jgi:hypothetical protein
MFAQVTPGPLSAENPPNNEIKPQTSYNLQDESYEVNMTYAAQ